MPDTETTFRPLVTVVTVTYNTAAFIQQTIDSVLAQSYDNFEYIIADDCSSDNTWEIIRNYHDPRIKAYRNETNLREYPNRNKAIEQATGRYLIFIDGDDLMYPHALDVFVGYAEQFPDCSMYFCKEWDYRIVYPYKISPADIYRFEYLDRGIMGGNFTRVFFNTGILQQTRLPLHVSTGDTYVQLDIGRKFPALVIPDGITWWRRRAGNATEQFFGSHRNVAETTAYRLAFLDDGCPMDKDEIDLAKKNIYGNFLRLLVRLTVKGHFKDVSYLLKTVKVPATYYPAIFAKGRNNYFDNIKGDNPLHS